MFSPLEIPKPPKLKFRHFYYCGGPEAHCSCPYTFSFPVAGLDLDRVARFEIESEACNPDNDTIVYAVDFPLSTQKDGIACLYVGNEEEMLNGRCDPDATGDDMTCPDDLVCAEGPGYSSDTPVCHTPCTESADCTPDEVFDCIDGLCRIAQPLTKAASE